MAVLVLGNLFRFARKDGVFSGKLPTDGWEKLEYHAEKQKLFTKEEIDHFCAVAISQNADGTPRFKNGEMLRDAVRLMSLSGARLASALALCWSDMNWERRQVTFWRDTKYSKTIIVDFNPELEALLKDLHSRCPPDTDALFPSNRSDGSESIASLRKSFELVREAANLPDFKFHSLRHYFVSRCVMAGIDLLTIAAWAGHADTVLHLNQDTTNTELHSPETRNANLKRCRPTPT